MLQISLPAMIIKILVMKIAANGHIGKCVFERALECLQALYDICFAIWRNVA